MIRDIASNLKLALLSLLAIASNTTTYSASFDTKDSDCGGFLAFICSAFTDGSYAVTLQESSDDSVFTDLDATQYNGGSTALTITAATGAAGTQGKLGAFSCKRYIRAKVVSTGVTTGATILVSSVSQAEVLPQ